MKAREKSRAFFVICRYVLDLPPSKAKTLERALSWNTRIYTSGWSIDASMALVAEGKKPFTSQCPRPGIRKLSKKYNIILRPIFKSGELIDYFGYRSENIDIVNLATENIVGNFERDRATYYFIFGVTLGYPITDVFNFCVKHASDSKSLNDIKQICSDYVLLNASICEVPLPA